MTGRGDEEHDPREDPAPEPGAQPLRGPASDAPRTPGPAAGPGPAPDPDAEHPVDRERLDRRRRVRVLGGAAALVAVVVAVVLAIGAFDDPTDGASRTTVAGVQLAGTTETRELLRDLPQDGTLLGSRDAPVTIHEFADLKCPACQSYEVQQQPETIETLVRTGRANLRIHFINVIDPGQRTTDGAGLINAAYSLAAKDRLWAFVHVLYFNQGPENQEWAVERRLRQIAAGAPGVDPADVSTRETPVTRVEADAARRLARRLGVRATPTVFVEPRGTARFARVEDPWSGLAAAVQAATPRTAPRSVAR